MGFKALLGREDYYGILQSTLRAYYKNKYNLDVYVGFQKRQGAKEMVMNPYLGMIYSSFPNKLIRKYIYKSYNIRNNLLKNIAAKLIVFISTHTRSIFTLPRRLYIYPASLVDDSIVFAYLNRSIRIFDFKQNTTISIKKDSFTSKFFNNQLEFRLKYPFEFVPAILNYSETWFEECILDGCSLARETDDFAFNRGIENALNQMAVLQQASCKNVSAVEYIDSIAMQISSLLKEAKNNKEIYTYSFTKEYLNSLLSLLALQGVQIPIAESHGDLQAGNIWLSKDNTWIIDWETHAMRSVWFDAITLRFGTRYFGGIKNLVLYHQTELTKSLILGKFSTSLSIRQMIIIFLLEDLLFNLEDMMELPSAGGSESFDAYINDIISTKVLTNLID